MTAKPLTNHASYTFGWCRWNRGASASRFREVEESLRSPSSVRAPVVNSFQAGLSKPLADRPFWLLLVSVIPIYGCRPGGAYALWDVSNSPM